MTQPEISALKEKAQKATPGPWKFSSTIDKRAGCVICENKKLNPLVWYDSSRPYAFNRANSLEFIAAASPQAILALIEMNEKMREALEFYKGNFDGKEGSYWLDGYKFIQEDKFGDTKHFDSGDRARQTIALVDGEVKA